MAAGIPLASRPVKELFQHAAMTQGITVRVAVNFMPDQSRVEAGKWFWVYHIRLENNGPETVQLLTRHWRITDGAAGSISSTAKAWSARPRFSPLARADYVSGCPLTTAHGSMEGFYTFRRMDGEREGGGLRSGDPVLSAGGAGYG